MLSYIILTTNAITMSRIQHFIEHIATLLPSENKTTIQKELMEYWLSLSDETNVKEKKTCMAMIKSGAKKGQACGKTCDEKFCKTHAKTEEKEDEKKDAVVLCKTIMKTGARKGQECGKVCKESQSCPSHTKTFVPKGEVVSESVSEATEPAKPAVSKCSTTITSGKRKGEVCGKPCVSENACTVHTKSKESKEKKETATKNVCGVMLKDKNQICGKPCDANKESCNEHDVIRIKKHGALHIIKGTNVIFDIETESAVGHLDEDGKPVYRKNDEVQTVCARYNISFVKK
jgi:hypothetical protein